MVGMGCGRVEMLETRIHLFIQFLIGHKPFCLTLKYKTDSLAVCGPEKSTIVLKVTEV